MMFHATTLASITSNIISMNTIFFSGKKRYNFNYIYKLFISRQVYISRVPFYT